MWKLAYAIDSSNTFFNYSHLLVEIGMEENAPIVEKELAVIKRMSEKGPVNKTTSNTEKASACQKSGHTAGPWLLNHQDGRINITKNDHDIVSHVASCFESTLADEHGGSAESNARLIAAAPDLLAALEELCADKYLSDPINSGRMASARAAIAKAKEAK